MAGPRKAGLRNDANVLLCEGLWAGESNLILLQFR
jgi:hypothetical protein